MTNALADSPNLEKLVLSKNALQDRGAQLIAYGLVSNTILQTLDIADNSIGALGLQALLDCLSYNHTVSSLSTVGNAAEDERAEVWVYHRKRAREGVESTHRLALMVSASLSLSFSLSRSLSLWVSVCVCVRS